MKTCLFAFLLLLSLSAVSQPAVYQGFEADSAAEPRGGMAFLTLFLQNNLRKPIQAEAAGIGGRVIMGGVVETDGRITAVNVMRSLRPDCDREAMRVFSLFNAWKPAQKAGKPVRQQVVIPVTFSPNTPFTFEQGARINYYNAENKPLVDSSAARYKQVAPLDSSGFPSGDIVLYKLKGKSWKEDARMPLVRKKVASQTDPAKSIYWVGFQNGDKQWDGRVVGFTESGSLINQTYYANGGHRGSTQTYHANGATNEKSEDLDDAFRSTFWYPTGQVKQVRTVYKPKPLVQTNPEQVTAFWDSTGRLEVNDGNGQATYQTSVHSKSDTTRQTLFVEQGNYTNGFKQGIWTGRYADGSYGYQEQYDRGICQSGMAYKNGGDTIRYTAVEQQAEFSGGMPGLGQFLSQNLRYPADAQRARAQGKVFISFTVCTDGTLCDYEVLKGVYPDLDREALRVVKEMSGRWKPGVQRGEKVRVKYNLPINFTLN